MSEAGGRPPLRIGTKERTAAMKALDEHLAEGRLTAEEYGERSAVAVTATTADELRELFVDLPAPHPALPGPAPAAASPAVTPDAVVPRPRAGLEYWGPRAVSVIPLVALGLFLLTRQWQVFLLIPLALLLLGGTARRRP
jgi:hypothetical protein